MRRRNYSERKAMRGTGRAFDGDGDKPRAAEIAKESARTGKTVRELCREKKILPEGELNDALDPVKMTEPGGTGSAGG